MCAHCLKASLSAETMRLSWLAVYQFAKPPATSLCFSVFLGINLEILSIYSTHPALLFAFVLVSVPIFYIYILTVYAPSFYDRYTLLRFHDSRSPLGLALISRVRAFFILLLRRTAQCSGSSY